MQTLNVKTEDGYQQLNLALAVLQTQLHGELVYLLSVVMIVNWLVDLSEVQLEKLILIINVKARIIMICR